MSGCLQKWLGGDLQCDRVLWQKLLLGAESKIFVDLQQHLREGSKILGRYLFTVYLLLTF